MSTMTEPDVTTTQIHRDLHPGDAGGDLGGDHEPGLDQTGTGTAASPTYDLRPGGAFRVRASEEFLAAGAPEVVVDGEVIESDPPRKLVQTWRMLMDPEMQAEGFTRLTYEIEPGRGRDEAHRDP